MPLQTLCRLSSPYSGRKYGEFPPIYADIDDGRTLLTQLIHDQKQIATSLLVSEEVGSSMMMTLASASAFWQFPASACG